jgi:hypothetical protein
MQQRQEESIQIDAFNTNLHGCKILCQGPFQTKYAPIMESIEKLREPFKKKILITRAAFSFSKFLTLQYDAIFQVKDVSDWSLILTYMTYAQKPTLVVIEDVQIPEAFWAKITKAITLVHISSTLVTNLKPYDAIFFAPIDELSSTLADNVYRQLQTIYRVGSQKEYREMIQELRVAGAGIAWTRFSEQLNWYDPVYNQGDSLSNKQMSELFSWLSQQFNK